MYQPLKNWREINEPVVDAYRYCFTSEITDRETNWVPHTICGTCHKMLTTCHKNKDRSCLKYSTPVIWGMPKSREDCYFCMTDTHGFNAGNRSKIKYASTTNVVQAVMISTKSGRPKKHHERETSAMGGAVRMEVSGEVGM